MNCPNCAKALKPVRYEGCSIHTCESCGGEFVAGESLAAIVRARQEKFPEAMVAQMRTCKPQFGDFCEARALSCPACENAMRTMNYSGDSGVCVDRCSLCGGMWLDHDELEKVQALMETWQDRAPAQMRTIAGKLEHARMQAASKVSGSFQGSRFSFVNAMINHLLDAA